MRYLSFLSLFAFFFITEVKAQVFNINEFAVNSIIDANAINHNFDNIKQSLKKYYNIDFNYNPVSNGDKITAESLDQNFEPLRIVVPFYEPSNFGQAIVASHINLIFSDFLDKFRDKYHAKDCEELRLKGHVISGYYGLDFDAFNEGLNPVITFCDFDSENNTGWTQVAMVNQNSVLWNVWSSDNNTSRNDFSETFGLKMETFSSNPSGRDLEVMIKVNGDHKNLVYYNVDLSKSFNPSFSTGSVANIQTGFFFRNLGISDYTRCESLIVSANTQWNWSIADNSSSSCAGTTKGGFVLSGNTAGTSELGQSVFGLNNYNNSAFSYVEIYVKKKSIAYPISCQHGLEMGVVDATGLYSIDVDSDGNPQTIHCEKIGSESFTLLTNFGNNTRYSNRGVLRNGVITNSQAHVLAGGYSTNANNWNNSGYPVSNSYLQYFLGSSGTGYISTPAPKWGGRIYTMYRALNGSGNGSLVRVRNPSGKNSVFGNITGDRSTTQNIPYSAKDGDVFYWEEYTSGVIGVDYIFVK